MAGCVFCKIVSGEIKADFLYRDEHVVCFRDLKPATPVHFLVAPTRHLQSPSEVSDADRELIGRMFQATARVARELGIAGSGYRMAINTGPDAGQEVPHMHIHVLGGRKFGWPPG